MWKFPDGMRAGADYGRRVEAMGDGHKNRTGNTGAAPRNPDRSGTNVNGTEQVLCHLCRDVIGIYEPMITLFQGHPHETSQAAEPDGYVRASECYHRACYLPEHSVSLPR